MTDQLIISLVMSIVRAGPRPAAADAQEIARSRQFQEVPQVLFSFLCFHLACMSYDYLLYKFTFSTSRTSTNRQALLLDSFLDTA